MSTRRGRVCTVTTPEAAVLEFEIGDISDRIVAFFVDLLLIALGMVLIVLVAVFGLASSSSAVVALCLAALFVLRQGYFLISELRHSGTTPGKRMQGLRVIARDGGPLTGEMIVARNLVRDVEFFLPVLAIMAPEALFPGSGGLAVFCVLWLLVFLLMPCLNRQRLRCGDLIAGTIVVRQPKFRLLGDVAAAGSAAKPREIDVASPYAFSLEELSHYGVKELQVLEDIFRRREERQAGDDLLSEIAGRIWKRIGRTGPLTGVEPLRFLEEFYRAQRAHLEQQLLFGIRKEHKDHVIGHR